MLERFLRTDPPAEALLLFEDADVERRRATIDQRVGVFLRELEAAGLIQSTDYMLDQAAAQGRTVECQCRPGEDSAAGNRLRGQLQRQKGT